MLENIYKKIIALILLILAISLLFTCLGKDMEALMMIFTSINLPNTNEFRIGTGLVSAFLFYVLLELDW